MMIQLIEKISSLNGVSGNEDAVREFIISEIKDKCEYYVDNLGNIIAFKKGKKTPEKKLMIAAHMDEVGFIVTYINQDGTLSFDCVGGVNADASAGRQVVICRNNINGVIGSKAVHNMTDSERKDKIKFSKLFIDIGAKAKEEAEKYVSAGDIVAFADNFLKLGNKRICSKALDDRVGCALMIDMINKELEYDVYFAFTVQEEVGLRGATAAAYTIAPDYAIVLETTTASDISGMTGARRVCELGKGAVVSYMDKRTIYDRELYELCFEVSKENGLLCQTKTAIAGGNDSGAIHISRGGVRTVAISVPCRYLHTASCLMDTDDIKMCSRLSELLISRIFEL